MAEEAATADDPHAQLRRYELLRTFMGKPPEDAPLRRCMLENTVTRELLHEAPFEAGEYLADWVVCEARAFCAREHVRIAGFTHLWGRVQTLRGVGAVERRAELHRFPVWDRTCPIPASAYRDALTFMLARYPTAEAVTLTITAQCW